MTDGEVLPTPAEEECPLAWVIVSAMALVGLQRLDASLPPRRVAKWRTVKGRSDYNWCHFRFRDFRLNFVFDDISRTDFLSSGLPAWNMSVSSGQW